MVDITPGLLSKIQAEFTRGYEDSRIIQRSLKIIDSGKATQANSFVYAEEVGKLLRRSLKNNISSDILPDGKMFYNIAERILTPTLENNHRLINNYTMDVQQILNLEKGLNIRAVSVDVDVNKIDTIIGVVSSDEFEKTSYILGSPIESFSTGIVRDSIFSNAFLQHELGLETYIVRTGLSSACSWCRSLFGEYHFKQVQNSNHAIWKSHDNCGCLNTFESR